MKTRWLDRRVAAPGPYLALCTTEAQFARACKDLSVQPPAFIRNSWSDASTHHFDGKHGLAIVVCLRDAHKHSPIEVAGLLVHEAVHVWQAHVDQIGEATPGREQEAYGIQCIAQELMAEYARQLET